MFSLPSSGKQLLLGGWDPTTLEPVPHIYILDFIETTGVACKWRRGASMLVPRSFFACGVVGPSTVCVAGGHDSQKNALRSEKSPRRLMLSFMISILGIGPRLTGVWPFSTTSPRAATGTGCVNRDKYQWSWFLGGEQQSQQQQSREAVKKIGNHRLFVLSGGGGRVSSTLDCGECDGEGAFLSDGYSNNGTIKWKHIHTPVGFSGFPYSASSLII
ncbi:hypothetical protein OIU78_025511 [Salix suchowensis]|nr:hypothetical protein OIU78_025511 [Salix suchowensis]